MLEMSRGRSNKEIALSLGIGVETVKIRTSAKSSGGSACATGAEAIRRFIEQEVSTDGAEPNLGDALSSPGFWLMA